MGGGELIHLVVDGRCVRDRPSGVGTSLLRHLAGMDSLLLAGHFHDIAITVIRLGAHRAAWPQFQTLRFIDTSADPEQHPRSDYWQQHELPRLLQRLGAHLLFSPAFTAPILPAPFPRALMIHDDLVWSSPSSYPLAFRTWLRCVTMLSARTSDLVVFPSDDARTRFTARFPSVRDCSIVVPNSVDLSVFRPTPLEARERRLLCVASSLERKNHRVLLKAFAAKPLLPFDFVGFGQAEARARKEEFRAIAPLVDWRAMPTLGDAALADTYARAAVLASPSRAEGFGIPLVEAMATGTPLVVSDIPVHREVAADAAVYVDPDDPEAWRAAITDAIEAGEQTRHRVALGIERARYFEQQSCSEKLLAALSATARAPLNKSSSSHPNPQ